MADQEWSEEGLLVPPVVRHQVEQPIQIELPPGLEAPHVVMPPVPDQAHQSLRAILDHPQLAAHLWQQAEPPAEAPPEEVMVQVGLALYYLHALHFQGKPGVEHLTRDRDEDDDRPA